MKLWLTLFYGIYDQAANHSKDKAWFFSLKSALRTADISDAFIGHPNNSLSIRKFGYTGLGVRAREAQNLASLQVGAGNDVTL